MLEIWVRGSCCKVRTRGPSGSLTPKLMELFIRAPLVCARERRQTTCDLSLLQPYLLRKKDDILTTYDVEDVSSDPHCSLAMSQFLKAHLGTICCSYCVSDLATLN